MQSLIARNESFIHVYPYNSRVVFISCNTGAVFFDLNTYKPKLYKLVKSQTGFDLEIKGPIGLLILPSLNLNADNVTLSDKKETLFRAKNLNIYLSLYSLFKGNLSFDGIKLDTAKIFIKKKVTILTIGK